MVSSYVDITITQNVTAYSTHLRVNASTHLLPAKATEPHIQYIRLSTILAKEET